MSIKLKKGGAVPIVITEKVVSQPPKTKRYTKFLGFKAGLSNLFNMAKGKVAEMIHQSFFHDYSDIEDPGVVDEIHYVIQVGGNEFNPELTIEKSPYKPPCGHHYEIIKLAEDDKHNENNHNNNSVDGNNKKIPMLNNVNWLSNKKGGSGFAASRPTPRHVSNLRKST